MLNFKLPLVLLALLGTAAAQGQSSAVQPPLSQLQTTARVLIVFAPGAGSASYREQLQMLERHSFELSMHNVVVVPISSGSAAADAAQFSFENLPLATAGEQAAARTRFHVPAGEFAVILLSQDGAEQIRSAAPVDIHKLMARLEALDEVEQPEPLTASLE